MKKEYIIGGCIGLVFIVAIIACIVISNIKGKGEQYTPTIAKIISLNENGDINQEELITKLEDERKSRLNEFSEKIKESAQNERYSMIILSDYIVHLDNNLSLRFKSNIKEYVELVDETKEGAERKIVTRAPDGFVDWILEQIGENK